jgi:hypothetical protein
VGVGLGQKNEDKFPFICSCINSKTGQQEIQSRTNLKKQSKLAAAKTLIKLDNFNFAKPQSTNTF